GKDAGFADNELESGLRRARPVEPELARATRPCGRLLICAEFPLAKRRNNPIVARMSEAISGSWDDPSLPHVAALMRATGSFTSAARTARSRVRRGTRCCRDWRSIAARAR